MALWLRACHALAEAPSTINTEQLTAAVTPASGDLVPLLSVGTCMHMYNAHTHIHTHM